MGLDCEAIDWPDEMDHSGMRGYVLENLNIRDRRYLFQASDLQKLSRDVLRKD
jgi:hypothetical protein